MIPTGQLITLDTNIVLEFSRGNERAQQIDQALRLLERTERPLISIVTVGELLSLARRLRWGSSKRDFLRQQLSNLVIVRLSQGDIVDRYAELDHFSQTEAGSARNMGKNDLWIAATAAATGSVLVTTDKDFDHLAPKHIKLIRWDSTANKIGLSHL